jgi:hypothetical protein
LWQRSTECVDGDSLDLEMGSLKGESWRPAIGASQHSEQPSRTERKKEAGEKDETISWSWVGLALFKDFKPVSLCNWAVLTFLKQRSVPHFFYLKKNLSIIVRLSESNGTCIHTVHATIANLLID